MSESTPNAGEKCPVCEGCGELETMAGGYITCDACQGTGLKPAVESPAAVDVMSLEIKVDSLSVVHFKQTCGEGQSFDSVYSAMLLCKSELDRQIVNKSKCPMSTSPAADVKELSEQEVKSHYAILKAMNAASDFAFRSKSGQSRDYEIARWHLSDLTTKLAELQVENERLVKFHAEDMRVTNESATFHMKRCRELEQANARANQLIGSQAEENDKIVNTLRAENQGLIKEVERLREALRNIDDHLRTAHLYPAHLTANWMQDEVKKAIKPTPEGE